MSYESVKQKILNSLVNRPAGTQIQPTKQQEYELDFLEYVKSLESISNSAFMGFAEVNTIPIQPNDANVFYISTVGYNYTNNYSNFRDSLGNVISVSTSASEMKFVVLNWNKTYWTAQTSLLPLVNSIRTKKVPEQEDYVITPADNGYLLSMNVSSGRQRFTINPATFPIGFNVKLHSYGSDGTIQAGFSTYYWNITPGTADEGNVMRNPSVIEVIKIAEDLWCINGTLESL